MTPVNPIARRREEIGLTRTDLAYLVGVSYSHLSGMESGRVPPTDDGVQRLALFLGTSPGELQRDLDRYAASRRRQAKEKWAAST
jgi:transcriptional regulator with XRE-family HTH domain